MITRRSSLPVLLTGLLVPVLAAPASASGAASPGGFRPRAVPRAGQVLSAAPARVGELGPRMLGDASGRTRLVVQLARGAGDGDAVAEAVASGAVVAHRLTGLGFVSFDVPAAAAERVATALRHREDVAGVETAPVWRSSAYAVDDPLYAHQAVYLSAVNAPTAWDTAKGSSTVKIAVVDTGVDAAHPDLAGKVVGSYNAVAGAPSTTDVTDTDGHGTFVSGVAAAATDNATGVAGVGFGSSLLAVKASQPDGSFLVDDVAAGIAWAADHGARVVNLSLGGTTDSAVVDSAISYAQGHGAVVVAAAGNEGGQPDATSPTYPAASPGVIAVGATDTTQPTPTRAAFSSYGSWVTVGAPGVGIYSTTPTGGSSIWPGTTGYDSGDGTSFSTSIVAGEAALLAAAGPANLTAAALRNAIVSSASGYNGLGLGAGQVDLAAALTKLPPGTTPSVTSPAGAAVVGGAVSLTASSTAPSVRFFVDGVALGSPVSVSASTATLPWESWGTPDGTHTVSAEDCNAYGCGDPSPPVTFTVQNAAPTVTSPAAAAVVSGAVGVDVTTQNAPPKVVLVVDGAHVGVPVAVSSNAAHLTWPSYGLANGTHTVGAAVCTSTGACGSSSSVQVDLENAAPVLTSPKVGQVVSGPFTVSATAPGGALVFVVGGRQVGTDTASPYSVPVNFSTFADGTYTMVVKSCTVTLSTCSGPTTSRSISVRSLHPGLATTPSSFSPNGDKRADLMTATVSLPDAEKVYWSVRNSAGTLVRGNVLLGYLSSGKHTFTWNGLNNAGRRVPDGLYTVKLLTSNATATRAPSLYGSATRQVRVDVTPPAITAVSAVTSTFYPYPDGYRDTISPKVAVNEPGALYMIIKSSAGYVVRTLVVRHSGAGTITVTWNGIINGGVRAPAGTYRYSFLAEDLALNRRGSSTYSVPVSSAKLVGTAVVKTVTPAATHTAILAGSCSAVAADSTWSGGYDYLSDYYCYDPYDSTSDIAASNHSFTLPAAIKYAGLSVTATGEEALAGYGDVAFAWYRDTSGNLVGSGAVLGSSYGTRSLGAASATLLYGGRTLRWTVATAGGMYYAVRSFTVRYTYYVLK